MSGVLKAGEVLPDRYQGKAFRQAHLSYDQRKKLENALTASYLFENLQRNNSPAAYVRYALGRAIGQYNNELSRQVKLESRLRTTAWLHDQLGIEKNFIEQSGLIRLFPEELKSAYLAKEKTATWRSRAFNYLFGDQYRQFIGRSSDGLKMLPFETHENFVDRYMSYIGLKEDQNGIIYNSIALSDAGLGNSGDYYTTGNQTSAFISLSLVPLFFGWYSSRGLWENYKETTKHDKFLSARVKVQTAKKQRFELTTRSTVRNWRQIGALVMLFYCGYNYTVLAPRETTLPEMSLVPGVCAVGCMGAIGKMIKTQSSGSWSYALRNRPLTVLTAVTLSTVISSIGVYAQSVYQLIQAKVSKNYVLTESLPGSEDVIEQIEELANVNDFNGRFFRTRNKLIRMIGPVWWPIKDLAITPSELDLKRRELIEGDPNFWRHFPGDVISLDEKLKYMKWLDGVFNQLITVEDYPDFDMERNLFKTESGRDYLT